MNSCVWWCLLSSLYNYHYSVNVFVWFYFAIYMYSLCFYYIYRFSYAWTERVGKMCVFVFIFINWLTNVFYELMSVASAVVVANRSSILCRYFYQIHLVFQLKHFFFSHCSYYTNRILCNMKTFRKFILVSLTFRIFAKTLNWC